MLRSRVCDERCFSLQRQGRLGTFSPVNGEEAAVVGSAWALDPARDWIVPQYRELPAMLRFGYRLAQAMQYYTRQPGGQPDGRRRQRAALPDLAGRADPARRRPGVGAAPARAATPSSATYFGDGASSEGDAHEAMNLAGVRRAPVVFVLKNNGWAISTPVRKQTAARELRRARGRLRHRRRARRRQRPLRDARRLHAGGRAGAGGGGADADRGPHLPHGPAQHLRRPDALRRSRRARRAPRLRPGRARAPLPDRGGAGRRGLRAGAGRGAARRGRRRLRRGAGERRRPAPRRSSTTSTRAPPGAWTPSAGRRRGRPADGRDDDDRGDPLDARRRAGGATSA